MDQRCPMCWNQGLSPYLWVKKEQGSIPKVKADLLLGLQAALPESSFKQVEKLTVTELRAIYKSEVKGKPHPADPTQSFSTKHKDELMAMIKAHQIVIPPGQKVNKGELMLMLRQHWHEQVAMAHEMHSQACPMPEQATPPPPGLHVGPESKNVKKGYKRTDSPEWEVVSQGAMSADDPKTLKKVAEAEKKVEEIQKELQEAHTKLAVEKHKAGIHSGAMGAK